MVKRKLEDMEEKKVAKEKEKMDKKAVEENKNVEMVVKVEKKDMETERVGRVLGRHYLQEGVNMVQDIKKEVKSVDVVYDTVITLPANLVMINGAQLLGTRGWRLLHRREDIYSMNSLTSSRKIR